MYAMIKYLTIISPDRRFFTVKCNECTLWKTKNCVVESTTQFFVLWTSKRNCLFFDSFSLKVADKTYHCLKAVHKLVQVNTTDQTQHNLCKSTKITQVNPTRKLCKCVRCPCSPIFALGVPIMNGLKHYLTKGQNASADFVRYRINILHCTVISANMSPLPPPLY